MTSSRLQALEAWRPAMKWPDRATDQLTRSMIDWWNMHMRQRAGGAMVAMLEDQDWSRVGVLLGVVVDAHSR